jgi:hypothetical protein
LVFNKGFQLARHGAWIKLDLWPREEPPNDLLIEAVGNEAVNEGRPIPACLWNPKQDGKEGNKDKRPEFSGASVNPFFLLPIGSADRRCQMKNWFRL